MIFACESTFLRARTPRQLRVHCCCFFQIGDVILFCDVQLECQKQKKRHIPVVDKVLCGLLRVSSAVRQCHIPASIAGAMFVLEADHSTHTQPEVTCPGPARMLESWQGDSAS